MLNLSSKGNYVEGDANISFYDKLGPWRNRWRELYTQYCYFDDLIFSDSKLRKILGKYGKAFDDNYCYRIIGRLNQIVVRVPIWLGWKEPGEFWREKYIKPKKGQTKLPF